MPDMEKVIKGLHDIAGFIAGRVGFEQARNFLRTIDDAIDLLKEQEQDRIEIAHEMVSNSILMYQGKEIVRCKDCKFFTTNKFDAEGYGNCKKDVVWKNTTTDWFCADGVK